jgi:endoglucanase
MTRPILPISRRSVLGGAAAALSTTLLPAGAAMAQAGLAGRDLMRDKRPVIHPDGPKLGAYDPYGDFSAETQVATEHLFLPWEDIELDSLGAADDYAAERGRKILITIEPWSWALDWNVTSDELRQRILAGGHDDNMRAILDAVSGFRSPITIRWAQEMESSTGRFTWQNWEPDAYIEPYRRMTGITREMIPSARMMWSPKGEENLAQYYPGDDVVDLVGLSVFGLDAYDRIEHGGPQSFAELLRPGYERTVGFGKPIWVAELGYEGELPYLADWVENVTRNDPDFPDLEEVIYFNDKEVFAWPHGLGLPNWRVAREQRIYPVRR